MFASSGCFGLAWAPHRSTRWARVPTSLPAHGTPHVGPKIRSRTGIGLITQHPFMHSHRDHQKIHQPFDRESCASGLHLPDAVRSGVVRSRFGLANAKLGSPLPASANSIPDTSTRTEPWMGPGAKRNGSLTLFALGAGEGRLGCVLLHSCGLILPAWAAAELRSGSASGGCGSLRSLWTGAAGCG